MAGQQAPASYWDLDETSSLKVAAIATKPPTYSKEDVVWHAWQAICVVYFPGRRAGPMAPWYSVEREAYRGHPPNEDEHKPDVIVVRLTNVFQQPGQPPVSAQRAVLWIECKAPDQDRPHGWNAVMVEAVTRLAAAHPIRSLFLILACGLKWMIFKWDPAMAQRPTTLRFLKHNGRDTWPVDSRISVPQFTGQLPIPGHPTLRYVRPQQNGHLIIDTRLADSLDYWSLDANQSPAYLSSMMFLENCFGLIHGSPFPGQNPPSF